VLTEVEVKVKGLADADILDLLAYLTRSVSLCTREQLVKAFRNRQQRFLERIVRRLAKSYWHCRGIPEGEVDQIANL
jgi:hypothetical protein